MYSIIRLYGVLITSLNMISPSVFIAIIGKTTADVPKIMIMNLLLVLTGNQTTISQNIRRDAKIYLTARNVTDGRNQNIILEIIAVNSAPKSPIMKNALKVLNVHIIIIYMKKGKLIIYSY